MVGQKVSALLWVTEHVEDIPAGSSERKGGTVHAHVDDSIDESFSG